MCIVLGGPIPTSDAISQATEELTVQVLTVQVHLLFETTDQATSQGLVADMSTTG